MSRRVQLAVHAIALVVLAVTVTYIAVRDDRVLEMALAWALGFGGGLLLDRYILRPTVDLSYRLRRT